MDTESVSNYLTKPEQLTYQVIRPFQRFFRNEASSTILLMAATVIALVWANAPFGASYHHLWETDLVIGVGDFTIRHSLREWIDEGLMSIFFFIVGLEIKREVLVGELATLKKAIFPVAAAIGGMLVPAAIYYLFNRGQATAHGWGIPMATDIAFALGAIFVLRHRVPLSLRIFLSAFAIADDIGAVLVIALFYTEKIVAHYFVISLSLVLCIAAANFFGVRETLPYGLLGILLWFAILGSGLHATVAGIVVAAFIPAKGRYDTDQFLQKTQSYLSEFQCPPDGCGYSVMQNERHRNAIQAMELACHNAETPLQRLEHALHPWVAFGVIPLFALVNAGLTLGGMDLMEILTSHATLGITLGLFLGKPIGVTLFALLAVKTGMASLPSGARWSHIVGAGFLGGIGFTMSLFISGLSFPTHEMQDYAKIGIIIGSCASGIVGLILLHSISVRDATADARERQ
ncbi:MAG: Na+/H+ antiporter NhaA [bacterium]|nr:Na+/H+ antiporter NhaA [bacterium]